MKPNIVKLLIIINTFIFVISLGIIYKRSLQNSQLYSKKEYKETDIPSTYASNIEIEDLKKQKLQQEVESKNTQEINDILSQQNIISQQILQTSTSYINAKLRKPKFVYFSSKAKKVSLIGDFNNWIPQLMNKINTKKWELIVEIPEGRYHYNFLVDGKPVIDPNNKKPPEMSKQGFKSSILELK